MLNGNLTKNSLHFYFYNVFKQIKHVTISLLSAYCDKMH